MTHGEITFEKAFERLEAIVEAMNSGKLSLEDSLKAYEEACSLLKKCEEILGTAEKKIEVLMKNRNNTLQLSPQGTPMTMERTQ